MHQFFQTRALSFRHAFNGWRFMLRTQRNAWIHLAVSLAVIAVSFWLHIGRLEWAIILIAVTMVWAAEFINTSLEAVVDLASPQQHYLAKIGKDVGAAAVLIAALSSVLIGLLVLGPPLWEKVQSLIGKF
jgi:diacylglycerol kinase (ATP)